MMPSTILRTPNRWRATQFTVSFFAMDARVVPFVALALLHFRSWTLALAAAAITVFWLLQRLGIRLDIIPRATRRFMLGPEMPAYRFSARRQPVDYQFEIMGWLYQDEAEWSRHVIEQMPLPTDSWSCTDQTDSLPQQTDGQEAAEGRSERESTVQTR